MHNVAICGKRWGNNETEKVALVAVMHEVGTGLPRLSSISLIAWFPQGKAAAIEISLRPEDGSARIMLKSSAGSAHGERARVGVPWS